MAPKKPIVINRRPPDLNWKSPETWKEVPRRRCVTVRIRKCFLCERGILLGDSYFERGNKIAHESCVEALEMKGE